MIDSDSNIVTLEMAGVTVEFRFNLDKIEKRYSDSDMTPPYSEWHVVTPKYLKTIRGIYPELELWLKDNEQL